MNMKKAIAAALAALCLTAGAQGLAEAAPNIDDINWVSAMLAADPSEGAKVVAVSDDSHLRSGPGLDYESIDVARAGATLTYDGATQADGRGVDWYRVKVEDQSLWVSSKYAELIVAPAATPEPAQTSEAAQTVTAEGGSANVRSGPGLENDTLGALAEGESAAYAGKTRADERGVDWYAIQWEGAGEAWVSSKYTVLK